MINVLMMAGLLVEQTGLESLGGLIVVLLALGEEDLVDLGQNTARGNGNLTEELVQLVVRPNGKLEMTGADGLLLVVSSSVSGQLKNLSSQVLQDGSQVDGGARTNALGIVALAQEAVNTTNGELQACLVRAAGGFVRVLLSSFSLGHGDVGV